MNAAPGASLLQFMCIQNQVYLSDREPSSRPATFTVSHSVHGTQIRLKTKFCSGCDLKLNLTAFVCVVVMAKGGVV